MTVGGCLLFHSILDILVPPATTFGLVPLLVLRCIQGFCGGAIFPALNAIVSQWSPTMERSRMSTVVFTGVSVGTVVGFTLSGFISSSEHLGGWSTVFYMSGTAGICWFLLWCVFVYETPSSHPTISAAELLCFPSSDTKKHHAKRQVPWILIFTSLPFWAVLIASIGSYLAFVMLLTQLPTYMSSVLQFNLKASGALSTLPYIANTIGAWLSSQMADNLRTSGKLKITTIRKYFSSVSGYAQAASLVAVTFCGCRPYLIIGLITLGMFINGAKYSGFNATALDMSPEFAGTIYGITLGIASLTGIAGPAMVGAITANGNTMANWGIVFYATAAVKFATTTFYLLFASAELQLWEEKEECNLNKESKDSHNKKVSKL